MNDIWTYVMLVEIRKKMVRIGYCLSDILGQTTMLSAETNNDALMKQTEAVCEMVRASPKNKWVMRRAREMMGWSLRYVSAAGENWDAQVYAHNMTNEARREQSDDVHMYTGYVSPFIAASARHLLCSLMTTDPEVFDQCVVDGKNCR